MNRRDFVGLMASAVTLPSVAHAQPPKQPKKHPIIGVLTVGPPSATTLYQSFLQGLRDLGWIAGENIQVEYRTSATRQFELAAELARMQVDVIFAASSTQVEAARQATQTIPIVFASHADPVGIGHVASLAHPGGNITGLSQLNTEFAGKGLEILIEAIPSAKRVGVLYDPNSPSHLPGLRAIESTAKTLTIYIHREIARTADEFDGALEAMVRAGVGALLIASSPLALYERSRLAEAALKHKLPGMFPNRENAQAGGLMSYGADLNDLFRRSAIYVDKILKGAKPADLPVEQAEKYQMVVNLKTAKALGVTFPTTVLARADEAID